MELREYVEVLRRRWRLVLVPMFLAGVAAAAITLTGPVTYRSTTSLFYTPADAGSAVPAAQRLQAYVALTTGPRLGDAVSRQLGGTLGASRVASSLSATASADTLLLDISATDTSPQRAQQLSQAAAVQLAAMAAALEPVPVVTAPAAAAGGTTTTPATTTKSPLVIAQPATAATSTRAGTLVQTLLLALVLGLLAGVILALVLEGMDDRITRTRQLSDDDELPTLTSVPYDRGGGTVGALLLDARGPWAEAFRRLRTRLFPVGRSAPQTVIVAGALPEVGATTVVCGLGLTLARAGVRVVVVGADLRNPSLGGQLWIPDGGIGLSEVLEGTASLDDALQSRGDGMLTVLPAGSTPANPGELLGSTAMAEILQQLEERFDVVVLEAPPVLPFADAVILSGVAGCGVLLVVRHRRTRRSQAQAAVRLLQESGVNLLGAVLTMVPEGPSWGTARRGRPRPRRAASTPDVLVIDDDLPEGALRRVESADRPARTPRLRPVPDAVRAIDGGAGALAVPDASPGEPAGAAGGPRAAGPGRAAPSPVEPKPAARTTPSDESSNGSADGTPDQTVPNGAASNGAPSNGAPSNGTASNGTPSKWTKPRPPAVDLGEYPPVPAGTGPKQAEDR